MAQKRSQDNSKRARLEESRARLRGLFDKRTKAEAAAVPAATMLREAWDVAADITAFAQKYLAHYMVDQETGQPCEPADFHREIYQLLLTEKRLAIAAPREHAKSTVVGLIFTLYCICYKLRKFIVLIQDTQEQTKLQLGGIKEELEHNEFLKDDFGSLAGEDKWGETDIVTSTGIRLAARGAGQSLRGLRTRQYRPDLVICDDLENDENVESADGRNKLERWFKAAVLNLGKACQVVIIGTILHFDSLLSRILDPLQYPTFVRRLFRAIDMDWNPQSILWPKKWPLPALREKEREIGSVFFNQEYRNMPVSEATQIFKESWFKQHQYYRDELLDKKIDKITGIDPAISQKEKADQFASTTIALDRSGFIYVTRTEGKRIPFPKQIEFIIKTYDMEKPRTIGVESVAYQKALKQALDEKGRETRRYFNVKEVQADTDKFRRISGLSPLVENGTIRFLLDGTQKELIDQLLYLGKTKDDLADSLEIAVAIARLGAGSSTEFAASESVQAHVGAGGYL
jgi:predicted phage terminase large subunit-like protein